MMHRLLFYTRWDLDNVSPFKSREVHGFIACRLRCIDLELLAVTVVSTATSLTATPGNCIARCQVQCLHACAMILVLPASDRLSDDRAGVLEAEAGRPNWICIIAA